jgi:pyruvate/2-oxoglutarate/acetoin dehydrogenase E1 component
MAAQRRRQEDKLLTYFDDLCEAMRLVSLNERSIFVGQAVSSPGTALFSTLKDVPLHKKLEFPVAENFQAGFCTGLALAGALPICIFPRINFMIEALPHIIQHLDKIPLYSDYRPKVIIRTAVATPVPLDAGPQHLGDYSDAIRSMLSTIKLVKLNDHSIIIPAYKEAMECGGSTILVEYADLY